MGGLGEGQEPGLASDGFCPGLMASGFPDQGLRVWKTLKDAKSAVRLSGELIRGGHRLKLWGLGQGGQFPFPIEQEKKCSYSGKKAKGVGESQTNREKNPGIVLIQSQMLLNPTYPAVWQ